MNLSTMEGWRSGQSQQTVNLPSLALRWFKSSSLHHFYILFISFILLISSTFLYSQEPLFNSADNQNAFITEKINAYIQHDKLNHRTVNRIRLVQAATYLSLFAINKEADFSDLTISGIYLYRFFYSPEFKSDLLTITNQNALTKIPELQLKLKKKRRSSSMFRLLSGLWLAVYVSSNSLNTEKTVSLTSVSSQLIATGLINISSKSANELFLDSFYKDLTNKSPELKLSYTQGF